MIWRFLLTVLLLLCLPMQGKTTAVSLSPVPVSSAPVGCTLTGVALSNNTFNSNNTNASVGTLSPTETGSGCASATYAVISSGTDHSGATCDTSGGTNFTVTGAAVTANSPSPAGAGTYTNECFQATVSGATGSPYTQAFTITGAATALPALQAINSGSTQTNVPFSIGIPFDVSMVDSSHHITASDSTNGALTCDETNRYSDIGGLNSGTPQVRGTTLSCNIPSWPNGADNITLAIASGAPGSGTDISTSDLTTANFDLTATVVTQAGTTETAQVSAAFANVGFVDVTTPAILGKWRSGGGVVTGYIAFIPFKNGGTADPNGLYGLFDVECYKAHTGAVNVSTNPILSCHTDLLTGNGVAELSSPLASDYSLAAYGISFTGGSGGTTTFTDWARTTPTQTLTFTNISATATITPGTPGTISWPTGIGDPNALALADNQVFFLTTTGSLSGTGFAINTPYVETNKGVASGVETITASTVIGGTSITSGGAGTGTHTIWPQQRGTVTAGSALWTSDSVGTVISDSTHTFYGVITNVASSTSADVSVYRPLPGLSTLTSGNYSLLPINHPYANRVRFSGSWVNTGTAAPLRVQNGNLYLGPAWDNSTHIGGPAPYFRSAKAMPNYNIGAPGNDPSMATFAATFDNCPPSENLGGGCTAVGGTNLGHNPSAYGSFSAAGTGNSVCGSGTGGATGVFNGPFLPDQQSSGDNGQVYMHPSWNVGATFLYDQYGYLAMFEDVDKFAFSPNNFISNALGAYPASDVNTYSVSAQKNYTLLASAAGWNPGFFGYYNACWYNNPNGGHASNQFALPYQMTGDWYILTHEMNYAMALAGLFGSVGGKGLDAHWLGAAPATGDERNAAWPLMIQAELVSFLPDNDSSKSTDAYKVIGGFTKPDAQTWQTAQWLSTGGGTKTYFCDTSPSFNECGGTVYSPGVNASCPVGGTCNPGFTNVSTPDLRFFAGGAFVYGFETGYDYNVFGIVSERGMCDADCKQAYLWIMQGQSSYITNTTVIGSPIILANTEHLNPAAAPNSPCNWYNSATSVPPMPPNPDATLTPTWANCYRAAYVTGFIGGTEISGGLSRYPSGTASLGTGFGTPGNTITIDIPTGYIASGGTTFYADGFFFVPSDGGYCKITTVNSATQFSCTVVNAFSTNSYTNTSVPLGGTPDGITLFWQFPLPYGGDAQGLEEAYLQQYGLPGTGIRYTNIQQSGCLMANEYIGFPITSTCNAINGFTLLDPANFPTKDNPIAFNIAPR